ncbi:hypothetical protein ACFWGI_35265 [Streptomyces niveus]|uniref:hypothetical protein n=1 Tax=Streptomyces niveus TaxID=193462 RepID=UPI003658A2F3
MEGKIASPVVTIAAGANGQELHHALVAPEFESLTIILTGLCRRWPCGLLHNETAR